MFVRATSSVSILIVTRKGKRRVETNVVRPCDPTSLRKYFGNKICSCADPESFVRGGPTLTTFLFSLMRGDIIQIPLLAGHQWPASETPMAFRWRADDGPTLNDGLVALLF